MFDWGTSNLRVYVVEASGKILERKEWPLGVKFSEPSQLPMRFTEIMERLEAQFCCQYALLIGMIGSGMGWRDVPMLHGPLSIAEHASRLFPLDGTDAYIVPGVTAPSVVGLTDMMRGEETQAYGALRLLQKSNLLLCMPGTHSKWVSLKDNLIHGITTSITGELFELLSNNSVLHEQLRDAGSSFDQTGFREGLEIAKSGLGAQNLAFSVRPRALVNCKSIQANASSYLSGILIGSEILAMKTAFGVSEIAIIAEMGLAKLYEIACGTFAISAMVLDGAEAVCAGASKLHSAHHALKD
ncbi:2-dehydro-3-deoxygalactonokinase [Cognatishimia sp. WU-CL00825]|uniref:2-dehydro-3-deoxygalactonokinase n=1 Tax=Cognatishimia sp. WU-CL00825 TaxID=3127658 RepID=UPI0033655B09